MCIGVVVYQTSILDIHQYQCHPTPTCTRLTYSSLGNFTLLLLYDDMRHQHDIERLEKEEAESRARAAKAREEMEQLEQLRTYVEAEEKMRAAETRVRELEAARMEAQNDILSATHNLDTMRSELYELPVSPRHHPRGDGNPKLNRLQAEAYIERHELDALMEDLLASLIEYMPTYPFPYLIKFLKQKAGIADNELELARDKIRDLSKSLQTETEEHTEAKALIEQLQAELAKTVKEVNDNAEQDRKVRDKLEQQKAKMEASVQREKDKVETTQASLTKAENSLRISKDELAETKRTAADAKQQLAKVAAELKAAEQNAADGSKAAASAAAAGMQAKLDAMALKLAASQKAETDIKSKIEAQAKEHEKAVAAAAKEAERLAAQAQAQAQAQVQAQVQAQAQAQAEMAREVEKAEAEADVAAEYMEEAGLSETFKSAPIVYTVRVKTGDKFGAGTDSHVYMHVTGEKGESGRLKLDKSKGHKDKFERARTDEFEVESMDVGKITNIIIGHDNHGVGGAWYLDSVRIDVPALGKMYTFEADRWLDKSKGDKKTEVEIPAIEGTLQQYAPKGDYTVTTRTGNESGASLDNASVFIMIYGTEGKSEEQKLSNGGKCFNKSGKVDEFRLQLEELGEMTKIRVRHNASGVFGNSWYLGSVEIYDAKRDILYKAAADRWLRKKEGVEAEFPITSKVINGEEVVVEGADIVSYEVTVQTGKTSGAGTDATVHVTVYGENGDTGDRPLRKSGSHLNKFETGNADMFTVQAADLGKLTRLKVWHDNNSMFGADWELDSISVVDPRDGTSTLFNCHAWLSKSKGLVKELVPASDGPAELAVEKAVGMEYRVTVITSKIKHAGTDANVHIILYGEDSDTGKLKLAKSSHGDKFQKGQTDDFVLNAVDVGEVKKVWIGHDNVHGMSLVTDPSWHLEKIIVGMPQLGKEVVFPANRWLAKGKDDGELECVLLPGEATDIATKEPWEVIVYTSNIKHAGTDANITMQVLGKTEDDENVDDHLDFKSKTTDDMFEKADVDRFGFELVDVGEPYKLIVEHDGAGWGADWHLDKVVFINPRTSSSYEFQCADWVKPKKPIELVLATKLGKTADGKAAEEKDIEVQLSLVSYTLKIMTSSDKNAGTDANITAVLHGTNGSSKKLKLDKSKTNRNKFEKGKEDIFEFPGIADLGEVTKVSIASDGHRGMKLSHPEWKLTSVEVESSTGATVLFECDQWFKKSDGMKHDFIVPGSDVPKVNKGKSKAAAAAAAVSEATASEKSASGGEAEGDVATDDEVADAVAAAAPAKTAKAAAPKSKKKKASAPPPRAKKSYKIEVLTGDAKKSGTDANVSLWMTGSRGKSTELKLEKSQHKDKFEKGQTDTFTFDMLDLGDLSKVKVKSDGKRGWSHKLDTQWFLDKVVVSCPGTKGKWEFECSQWFSNKDGKEHSFTASGGDSDDEHMAALAGR